MQQRIVNCWLMRSLEYTNVHRGAGRVGPRNLTRSLRLYFGDLAKPDYDRALKSIRKHLGYEHTSPALGTFPAFGCCCESPTAATSRLPPLAALSIENGILIDLSRDDCLQRK